MAKKKLHQNLAVRLAWAITVSAFVIDGYLDTSIITRAAETETVITENVIIPDLPNGVPTEEEVEQPYYYDVPLSHELQDYIRELCHETGTPMSLAIAMINHESTFNPNCVSKTRDYGLMQINKCNHARLRKEYGITDFLDPYQNVNAGIHMIGGYLVMYGDEHYALMAYNMGDSKAKKLWKKGVRSSKYSRTVMGLYEVYETNRKAEEINE